MLRVLPFVLALALTIYALIDAARSYEDEVAYLPKPWWVVLILLVPVLGPLAWLGAGRRRREAASGPSWFERARRAAAATGMPGRPGPVAPAQRPRPAPRPTLAPDDDPDFLARLRRDNEDGPTPDNRPG